MKTILIMAQLCRWDYPYLTNGELKFIEEWIKAGSPETGSVVDSGCSGGYNTI